MLEAYRKISEFPKPLIPVQFRVGVPTSVALLRMFNSPIFKSGSTVAVLIALASNTSLPGSAAEKPPEQEVRGLAPMLESNIDRPLRYFPEGGDFVITNGAEYFNRPLYVANSAFRIDGGDRPEFSFYLPGRGGNLRFGLRIANETVWLDQSAKVISYYRPGSLIYEMEGKTSGEGTLSLTVLPLKNGKGLIGRVVLKNLSGGAAEFIMALGGANGMKGRRNGDIGCEREPVSEFFRLRPEQCKDDRVTTASNLFILRGKAGTLTGVLPRSQSSVGDAKKWASLANLISTATAQDSAADIEMRLAVAARAIALGKPFYFLVKQIEAGTQPEQLQELTSEEALEKLFLEAEQYRRSVADRVTINTPDPFINAAMPALNIAAEAVWDDQLGAYMHGGVAWRVRLLGWRASYAGDDLGTHERTARHFEGFAKQQNIDAVPEQIPQPEASANLSRNETALHSNGDLTKSHYDMNLVAVDAFFRHLLWTGDLEYARRMWPTIERDLAWERRLFRREFGAEKLPLYEAYAAIWASDDLAYNGGGATHASAYNFYHNQLAARVAKLIGKDPSPYEREAELIAKAMRQYLWLADRGWFAEWKDYLGEQRVHPNAAVWTFYHTIDCQVPTTMEAWQMSRFVDTQIARIPVRGPNVPEGNFTIPTTSWMPYTWSLNNVVMAESMHTALAYWQADRANAALPLFKGALLDSMYLGLCPGNLGATTFYDANRRETQRDFGDAVGTTSRALIEGLFGVQPDALAGELKVQPGFPASWNQASIRHPDFDFAFTRVGNRETYTLTSKFPQPMKLRLQIPALREDVESVSVNGKAGQWRTFNNVIGKLRIEIDTDTNAAQQIVIEWKNARPESVLSAETLRSGHGDWNPPDAETRSEWPGIAPALDWKKKFPPATRFDSVDLTPFFNDRVTQIFRNEYLAPRSPFCSLATPKQGIGSWCHPTDSFDVDDSGLRAAAGRAGGKIVLPNGVPLATPSSAEAKNILFTSQWTNYPSTATIPLSGKASHAFLLMAGSTDAMQSRFENGEVVIAYTDGSTARLPLVNPINWWPIDQDYFIDDFAFRRPEPIPPRVDLKTGLVRVLNVNEFKGKGRTVPGGAATVLDLSLDSGKELKTLGIHSIANEVVVGLMAVTLQR